MNDKQFLQRMHKMTKETHWVKSSLSTVLQYLKDGKSIDPCKIRYDAYGLAPEYKIGKMGYCLMGLVGHLADMPTYDNGIDTGYLSDVENTLYHYPQADRITRILHQNLPERFRRHIAEFDTDTTQRELYHMALDIEGFNDNGDTGRQEVLDLLQRCIDNYQPSAKSKAATARKQKYLK